MRIISAVVVAALVFATCAQDADAQLTLLVSTDNQEPISIVDNGSLDTDPRSGVIDVNTSALNAIMSAYSEWTFTSLSAQSNALASTSICWLSVTGMTQFSRRGAQSPSYSYVNAEVSDNFFSPAGPSNLVNSASGTFTGVNPGDQEAFWGSVAGNARVWDSSVLLTSSGPITNSQSATTSPLAVPKSPSLGLLFENSLSLYSRISNSQPPAEYQFTALTELVPPIPEPSRVGLLALVGAFAKRRRFRLGAKISPC